MEAFEKESTIYRNTALDLVKVQAVFFPLILLLIGLSTVITIYIGGIEVAKGTVTAGNIAEFIIYVNQLTFPAMSLAWVTSLVQRAAASQKRINEFLETQSPIINGQIDKEIAGEIKVENISFTYPETGIQATKNISL